MKVGLSICDKCTVKHCCILPSLSRWQLLGIFLRDEGFAGFKNITFRLILPVCTLGFLVVFWCVFSGILLDFRIFFDTLNIVCTCCSGKLSTALWTRAHLLKLAFPPTTNLCWVSTIPGMTSHCERPVHCTCLHAGFWLCNFSRDYVNTPCSFCVNSNTENKLYGIRCLRH